MGAPGELGQRFIAARRDAEGDAGLDPVELDEDAIGRAVAALIARGRDRFADLAITDAPLVALLARSAELPADDLAGALAATSEELVLTAAAVAGDATALAILDRDYASAVRVLVGSIAGDRADDVLQEVWMRLLVARDGVPGRLADYGGRGSLLTWLRVVAAREAISALRRRREVAVDDEVLFGRLVASQDPSLALIRKDSAAAVKRAFEDAVAALTVRERNLLRQHVLDGLTIDDLGGLYGVHRVTASRWLVAAREAVWARTQAQLRERLRLTPTEIDSLLAEVRDWIDFSLERVL